MTIRELKRFIDGLNEDVLDKDVIINNIFSHQNDEYIDCIVELDTDTEALVRNNNALVLNLNESIDTDYEELCIVPDYMGVIIED